MIVGNPAWVACDVAWCLQDLDPFELVTGGDQGVGHGLGGQGEDEVVNGVSIALLDDLHGRDVRVDRPHRRGHLAKGAGDVRDLDTKNEHDPIVLRREISPKYAPACETRGVQGHLFHRP